MENVPNDTERTSRNGAQYIMGSNMVITGSTPERSIGFTPSLLKEMCEAGFVLTYLGGESIKDLFRLGAYDERQFSGYGDHGFMRAGGEAGWYLLKIGPWRVAPHFHPSLRILEAQRAVQAHYVLKSCIPEFFPSSFVVTENRLPHLSHLPGSTLPVVMLKLSEAQIEIETRPEQTILEQTPALWGFRETYRTL